VTKKTGDAPKQGRRKAEKTVIDNETIHNLGGLMRRGETGDGPIVRRSCDPY